jgi:group I intron endonuclease
MNDSGDAYKVYKLTSPSEKVYIGITCQTLQKRFMNGRGYKGCPAIYKAIKKYGWNSIKHEILFENLTKEEAEQKEIELIAFYKSNQKSFGYNIENGGNTTGTHSEETKRKISEANKGKKVSEETRQKLSNIHKGRQSGINNPFYGRHHSKECKREHSEFMKGNKYNLGNHHSEEFKKWKSAQMKEKYSNGRNPRCKKVYRIIGDEIVEYPSLRAAAKAINKSPSWLCKLINDSDNKEWDYEKRA